MGMGSNTGRVHGPGAASRRGFLKAGAAASALPAISVAWPTGLMAATATLDLYKVVYDRDHPAAQVFGRAALAAGLPAQAIGRDVTSLWYDDLHHRWKQGPAAIAGLTPLSVAFVLELFAQDVGMRTLYRAEHNVDADGNLQHALTGPQSMMARSALLDTGPAWGAGLAKLIGACPVARGEKSSVSLACTAELSPAHAEPLVSWVFAPVNRA